MASANEIRIAEILAEVAASAAAGVGLEVLSVKISGGGRGRMVRVDVDRAGPVGVNLDDCGTVSAALGDAIEAAGLFDGPYTLEVSSPGIDRPIRTSDDVRRNTGRRVVVETRAPIEGKTRFRGVLTGESGANWILRGDDGTEWALPSEHVIRARQDSQF